MNNRQKAKHFKKLYEYEKQIKYTPIITKTLLPKHFVANCRIDRERCEIFSREHGIFYYWEAKDFIADYYKNEATNKMLNQIKDIVKSEMDYTCDERGISYTFDVWVK